MVECTKCGERKHHGKGLCKRCYNEQYRAEHRAYEKQYRAERSVEKNAYNAQYRASNGGKSMSDNKDCPLFLGVHVAERVLSRVFKNVIHMPMGNPGYDFICNHGKKIDVKSCTIYTAPKKADHWQFRIHKNTTADYFLCIAFDNRDDLKPLHIWLLPGHLVNDKIGVSIAITTIDKWDEYRIDIDKVVACCDKLKTGG